MGGSLSGWGSPSIQGLAVAESCEAAEGVQGNRKMIIGTGVGLV